MINENDIITCKNYKSLCDYIYCPADNKKYIPNGGVVWCALDDIVDFFDKIKGTNNKYVVVSSYSDFGLCYQHNNTTGNDLIKYVKLCVKQYPNCGYQQIQLPPTCNVARCNPLHKYSIKCYRFTHSTFDEIPNEVKHWFCVNNIIEHENITTIPFGIAENKEKYFANIDSNKIKKKKCIYINFNNYTLERELLKEQLRTQLKNKYNIKIYIEEKEIPFEEYLEKLLYYKYVLCPPGNGLDCYRTLETLYTYGVPILEQNNNTNLLNIPGPKYHPSTTNLLGNLVGTLRLNKQLNLESSYLYYDDENFSSLIEKLPQIKLSYWKKQIEYKCDEYNI